jgi:hypothetical protein
MEEGLNFLKEALAKKDLTIAKVMVGALGIYLSELSRNLDLPYIWAERERVEEFETEYSDMNYCSFECYYEAKRRYPDLVK